MSLAETLGAINGAAAPDHARPFDQRPRIVGPGGAAAAVDAQLRGEAEAAEQARIAAIEVELQLERERLIEARNQHFDRLAIAFNSVFFVERQRGLDIMTREGAEAAETIQGILENHRVGSASVGYLAFLSGALTPRRPASIPSPLRDRETIVGSREAAPSRGDESAPPPAPPAA